MEYAIFGLLLIIVIGSFTIDSKKHKLYGEGDEPWNRKCNF